MIGEIILPLALSTVTVWQDEYYFPMLPVLQMGKLRSRERQLVVEEGLEPRSPDSQDGQQHDAEKRGFRAREP